MSATARAASARPATRRAPSRTGARTTARTTARRRPSLVEVPAPAPSVAGNGVFALVVVAMLVGGMVLLLVLNTSLAQGAFEISALQRAQNQLAVDEQRLVQEVALAEAPESLQRRAAALGMVPVTSPVFLRLADGKVLGTPYPAKAAPRPVVALPSTGVAAPTVVSPAKAPASAAARTATAPTTTATADPVPVSDAAKPDTASTP